MSNVIQLAVPHRSQGTGPRLAAMIHCFALERRFGDDVFWLKENAELLNILECTRGRGGVELPDGALAPHLPFYAQIEKRLEFFPQYYRFLLSMCLDLEDLGLSGGKGERLCAWAAREDLAGAELSDLQRAEARRLMARRGIEPLPRDHGLDDRLRAFAARTATFALPNKKAAYELTHIVFYLSEYGRRDPGLDEAAITSLEFTGLLAYLDQNADLLAEVCIALRYAGRIPSPIWEQWLERETHRFAVETGGHVSVQDDYHDFFVCNWLMAVSGRDAFVKEAAPERSAFTRALPYAGPLRDLSEAMLGMEERSKDWLRMRPLLEGALSETGYDILVEAEQSSDKFGAFFEGFARTALREAAL